MNEQSTSDSAAADVCDFLDEVNAVAAQASSPQEGLAALTEVQPKLAELAASADGQDCEDLATPSAAEHSTADGR